MNGNIKCLKLLKDGCSVMRYPNKVIKYQRRYIPSKIKSIYLNPINFHQRRSYSKKKINNKIKDIDKTIEEILKTFPKDVKFEDISADEVFSDPSTKNMNDLDKAAKVYNTYLKAKLKNKKELDELDDMDEDDITFEDILNNLGGAGLGRRKSKSKKKTTISSLMNELNELKDEDINEELQELLSDPESAENPLFNPFEVISKDEPIPEEFSSSLKLHNKEHDDPFAYLRNIDSDETAQKYCSEEENYGNLLLANNFSSMATYFYMETSTLTKNIEPEIHNKMDDYYYYRVESENDFIYMRKKGLSGKEEVFFDAEKEYQQSKGPVLIKDVKISSDHNYFGFLKDSEGEGICQLVIREMNTGKTIKTIENVVNYDFSKDNFVYYTDLDFDKKPTQVKRYDIKKDVQNIVFFSTDGFYVDVYSISDYEYVIMVEYTTKSVTTYLVTPDNNQLLIYRGKKEGDIVIKKAGDHFYALVINKDRTHKTLKRFTVKNAIKYDKWEEFIPYIEGNEIVSINTFEKYLVLRQKIHSYDNIRVYNLETGEVNDVPLPSKLSTVRLIENSDYYGTRFKYAVSSPLMPPRIYEYDMKYNKSVLLDKDEFTVPKGGLKAFNPEEYEEHRVFVGKNKVPLSLVHKKTLVKDGKNPTLVIVYGSHGIPLETAFDTSLISLLERNFIIAFAHVRGGGEKGEAWHNAATLFNKQNSFDDFIDCTNYLINEKYTSSEYLAAKSRDEGCIILGYVANNYPNLYKVLSMNEPIVDLVGTLVDDERRIYYSDLLEEYGDPLVEKDYNNIIKYDPYTNIKEQEYPNILITCGSEFSKYPVYHGLKYTAKLRKLKINSDSMLLTKPKLLALNISPEQKEIKDRADELAFICGNLGVWPKRFE